MNILIAPDKFKGSLTAPEVGEAIAHGLAKFFPDATIRIFPLADGGEGTLDVLSKCFDLQTVIVPVHDPLARPIHASYGLNAAKRLAVVEMARASGLALLKEEELNPLMSSTIGTGELIKDAISKGVTTIYLTVGGSATNDGGTGMADAVGYRFLDAKGQRIIPNGGHLQQIEKIERPSNNFDELTFVVLTDVQNPLTGPHGASAVYGPQKGATPSQVDALDKGLQHLAVVIERDLGVSVDSIPGGGAAGGLGAGALAFLGATVEEGCESIMRLTGFDSALDEIDLIITGEGRIDKQTTSGKVVSCVARKALAAAKKTLVVAGQSTLDRTTLSTMGISDLFCLTDFAPVREAFSRARALLETAVAEAITAKIRQIG